MPVAIQQLGACAVIALALLTLLPIVAMTMAVVAVAWMPLAVAIAFVALFAIVRSRAQA